LGAITQEEQNLAMVLEFCPYSLFDLIRKPDVQWKFSDVTELAFEIACGMQVSKNNN
jgi:hypothetical protein